MNQLLMADAPKPEFPKLPEHQTKLQDPGKRDMPAPPPTGFRQDVFSLTEGPITVQWPAYLSADSFQDMADWLDLLKRKIGRSVKSE